MKFPLLIPTRSIEWFIAWRYLFSRERKSLVSAITLISVTGVAVGVAALIVVIGVMDGANELLFSRMTSLFPHLRITTSTREDIALDPALLARLRVNPEMQLAEPVLQKLGGIQSARGIEAQKQGIQLIGVDELGKSALYRLPRLKTGETIRLNPGEILLGTPMAKKLNVKTSDTVTVLVPDPARSASRMNLIPARMRVKGTYDTGFYTFDANNAFINKDQMRRLFGMRENHASYIHVKLKDPFKAPEVKQALDLGENYFVTTWKDESGDFFSAIQIQKFGLFIILLLIILVAAFNIIGTLILMVIEKTREVGILRAVGASEGFSARIFLIEGMLIGLAGTLAGLVLGLVICALIPLVKIQMPAQIYNFDHLPVTVNPVSVVLIVISSMAICTLAALFPARQAAKLNPVEALRYD